MLMVGLRSGDVKEVNTVPEAVSVWSPIRYISDTDKYQCTVSDLPLFYIIYITNNKCEFWDYRYLKNIFIY